MLDFDLEKTDTEATSELPEFEDLFFYHIRSSESTGFGIFSTMSMVEIGNTRTASDVYGEFFTHIRSGDACELRQLLNDYRLNINVQDNSGMTGLSIAAIRRHTEIISILLEHHADVNVKDDAGQTPLSIAIKDDWVELAKILLEKGSNPNQILAFSPTSTHAHFHGYSVLNYAIASGNPKLLELILKHGASLEMVDPSGRVPYEELTTSYCDQLRPIFWKYFDEAAKQRFILTTISRYNLPALTYGLTHVSEEIKQAVFQSRINGVNPLVFVTLDNRSAFAKVLLDHGHELLEKKRQDMTNDEKETRKLYKNTLLYKMHEKRWRDILLPLLENITQYEPTPSLIDVTANAVARNVNCDESQIKKLGLPPELNERCLQAYELFNERKKHLKPPHVKAFLQKANSLSPDEINNINMTVAKTRAEKRRKQ